MEGTLFLELQTNHRFQCDPEWVFLLQESLRDEGLTKEQVKIVNQRVVTKNPWIPTGQVCHQ